MSRIALLVFAVGAALGCGARGGSNDTLPARHLSAEEHEAEASRHEREAEEHEARAERYEAVERSEGTGSIRCFDRPLEGVTYSGGEPIETLRPCWTSLTSPSARERNEAEDHRRQAARHRARATELRTTEARACAGLGEYEIAVSPFAQRRDIVSVEPYRDGSELRGVRVTFRRVPGLSAGWMRQALACHAARAATLGYPATFMSYDPSTLPDVALSVVENADTVIVTVRSDRSEIAAAALGRAEQLHAGR